MTINIGAQWNYIKEHRFSVDWVKKRVKDPDYSYGRYILHLGPIAFDLAWCKP